VHAGHTSLQLLETAAPINEPCDAIGEAVGFHEVHHVSPIRPFFQLHGGEPDLEPAALIVR
jgi:hypothetical protein